MCNVLLQILKEAHLTGIKLQISAGMRPRSRGTVQGSSRQTLLLWSARVCMPVLQPYKKPLSRPWVTSWAAAPAVATTRRSKPSHRRQLKPQLEIGLLATALKGTSWAAEALTQGGGGMLQLWNGIKMQWPVRTRRRRQSRLADNQQPEALQETLNQLKPKMMLVMLLSSGGGTKSGRL